MALKEIPTSAYIYLHISLNDFVQLNGGFVRRKGILLSDGRYNRSPIGWSLEGRDRVCRLKKNEGFLTGIMVVPNCSACL